VTAAGNRGGNVSSGCDGEIAARVRVADVLPFAFTPSNDGIDSSYCGSSTVT
jgi:hypothetical protein